MDMFTLVIRSVLLYFLILVVIRLMGKRQIGQMQPFELVLTLIIADIATIPMSETKIPFLHGVVPLLTLLVAHFFIAFICQKSVKLNCVINGKPVVVVSSKGIDWKALKSLGISVDDLMEGIRGKGYFSFDEVEYVIVETTGVINVMPKNASANVTKQDLNINSLQTKLPVMLISEGTIMKKNMQLVGLCDDDLLSILKKAKISKIKNVVACTLDPNGKVFIQDKKNDGQTFLVPVNKKMENAI